MAPTAIPPPEWPCLLLIIQFVWPEELDMIIQLTLGHWVKKMILVCFSSHAHSNGWVQMPRWESLTYLDSSLWLWTGCKALRASADTSGNRVIGFYPWQGVVRVKRDDRCGGVQSCDWPSCSKMLANGWHNQVRLSDQRPHPVPLWPWRNHLRPL